MDWRDVLAQALADAQNDNGDGTRSDVYYPPNPRAAAWVETALCAMPTPDRIALARELLAGTGQTVAPAPAPLVELPHNRTGQTTVIKRWEVDL
jgi:hypothetical protein